MCAFGLFVWVYLCSFAMSRNVSDRIRGCASVRQNVWERSDIEYRMPNRNIFVRIFSVQKCQIGTFVKLYLSEFHSYPYICCLRLPITFSFFKSMILFPCQVGAHSKTKHYSFPLLTLFSWQSYLRLPSSIIKQHYQQPSWALWSRSHLYNKQQWSCWRFWGYQPLKGWNNN